MQIRKPLLRNVDMPTFLVIAIGVERLCAEDADEGAEHVGLLEADLHKRF
ncbi:MAG: hypothetical protein ACE5I3_12310 [Phycisphaerae bacterium]